MTNICFVLDWDDTLYPTSYLNDFDIEDADWTKHLKVVVCLLKFLMGLGNVVIVLVMVVVPMVVDVVIAVVIAFLSVLLNVVVFGAATALLPLLSSLLLLLLPPTWLMLLL